MKILNKEIEFDFLDIESMAKYEEALEKYMKELEKIKEFKGKNAEGFKMLCETVYNFFDEILEKGSAVQILGEKRNLGKCTKAMQEIMEEKLKSDKEVEGILGKYSLDR
ncbi:MAG: hypothetical protein HFJ53_00980 [Clostridia bacterium]|jgi:hypothetical protein|nr:hypothetical protein [Clostridia bacterium]